MHYCFVYCKNGLSSSTRTMTSLYISMNPRIRAGCDAFVRCPPILVSRHLVAMGIKPKKRTSWLVARLTLCASLIECDSVVRPCKLKFWKVKIPGTSWCTMSSAWRSFQNFKRPNKRHGTIQRKDGVNSVQKAQWKAWRGSTV